MLEDQHCAMRNTAKYAFQGELIIRSFLEHMPCPTLPYPNLPYTTLPCPFNYLPISDASFETGRPAGLEI